MRSRNYVGSDDFAQTSGSSSACFNSSLDSANVSTDHNAYQTGTDLLRADQDNVRGFYHSIGSFDRCDKTSGFNHTESFHFEYPPVLFLKMNVDSRSERATAVFLRPFSSASRTS